jgi:hypothetical protein
VVEKSFSIRRTDRIPRAASLCPGSGAGGGHDWHPSRSRTGGSSPEGSRTAPDRQSRYGPGFHADALAPGSRGGTLGPITRRTNRLDLMVPPRRSLPPRGRSAPRNREPHGRSGVFVRPHSGWPSEPTWARSDRAQGSRSARKQEGDSVCNDILRLTRSGSRPHRASARPREQIRRPPAAAAIGRYEIPSRARQ